jgi:HEAT repeat protein
MDSALIDPWVRGLGAAATLTTAGYTDDASRFYRGCLTSIGSAVPTGKKNDWLQDQCINGALMMGPNYAGALFAELWEEPHMNFGFDMSAYGAEMPISAEIQAVAAHGLGKLVGSGQLTNQQRSGVMQALVDMVQMKKPDLTALTGGVQGLSFAEDSQAVRPLQTMWKKGKPKEIRPVALGGLVAAYRDPDAIQAMRKELKTGTGIVASYKKATSFAPWTSNANEQQPMSDDHGADDAEARYLAARALIRAGDDAGYEFAAKFLDKRNVPPGDWDYRPDLIRDLVETGGDRSLSALDEMVMGGHHNEWLEAMMRTGLLELGDRDQFPELLALVGKRDWDFGRGTAARWYKRFKPMLWQGIKMAAKTYMGMPPDQQDWQRVRQMVTNMAWGERDRILARKSERDVKTDQFRWQLADSAGELDDPQCLSILAPLLGDDEPSVRMSAASALLDQSGPGSANLLFRALTLDYGAEQDISRNPEIHAAVTLRLIRTFPDHPATPQALSRAVQSDSPSVRFLALTAQQQLADQTVDGVDSR